jgi:hypothetical protein
VDVEITPLIFSRKAFTPICFTFFKCVHVNFFCKLMSTKTTQTSTHLQILQMGENMIKGTKGAKVKMFFQRLHMTHVISMWFLT